MSAPPYMPLFVGDYLADTTHLTCTEHGAYLLLLMAMWRAGGSLPNDPKKLARFARCTSGQWARISETILNFFDVASDAISHGRLTHERTKHAAAVEQRRHAASNGGKAKAQKNHGNHMADASAPLCQPEPEPEPEKKVGGVVSAREAEIIPLEGVSDDWPSGDLCKQLCEIAAAPALDTMKSTGLVTTAGRLAAWRREGLSWEHDVVPIVTELARKTRQPIASWKFFDAAMSRALAANREALATPQARIYAQDALSAHRQPSFAERDAAIRAEARRRVLEG